MSKKVNLKKLLGEKYIFTRTISNKEIAKLRKNIPDNFTETAVAVMTAGCLRLTAVLYPSCKELLLGYDVFVKDDADSPEWILFESITDTVSLKESDMQKVLDRFAVEHGLSYTESLFTRLDGKLVEKKKPPCDAL